VNTNVIWLLIIIACAIVVLLRARAISNSIRTQGIANREVTISNLVVMALAIAVLICWLVAIANPTWSAAIALLILPATVIAYSLSILTTRPVSASRRRILSVVITSMVVVLVVGATYALIMR
jgi:hypothetical protein